MASVAIYLNRVGAALMAACILAVMAPAVFWVLTLLKATSGAFPYELFLSGWSAAVALSVAFLSAPDVARWVRTGKQSRN